jgi:hypothetical protein
MLDIRQFGAVPDGTTINTRAIQEAIDTCSRDRHSGVLIQAGTYLTGTLHLKDNVTLHVAGGATLLGSGRIDDYANDTHKNMYKNEPHMDRCLLFARNATGIAIEGNGVIDGQGHQNVFPNPDDPQKHRPMLMRLLGCKRIRMRDITLQNPASWTSAWLYCSDIAVDGVTIRSRVNSNGDGLDFDGCRDVRVSNCSFDTSDDSICLQTSRPDAPCRDVTISNCTFTSKWAGIRIGLLSRGDFENVAVTNCSFRDIDDSGLKIQMCEGAAMRNMIFSNLVMTNVPRPVFLTLCRQRACVDAPEQLAPVGSMRRLVFSNIAADSGMCGKDSALVFVGHPDHPVQDIVLDNIHLQTGGGWTSAPNLEKLPDLTPDRLAGWWPEYERFKTTVPCHGIYAEHIAGLAITNSMLGTAAPDNRPAIACHQVTHARFNNMASSAGKSATIYMDGKPALNQKAESRTGGYRR